MKPHVPAHVAALIALLALAGKGIGELVAAQRALGEHHEVTRTDSTLLVATTGSVADMADLFNRLKEGGIEPTGFANQEPTLDDVFFKILDDHKEQRHANAH